MGGEGGGGGGFVCCGAEGGKAAGGEGERAFVDVGLHGITCGCNGVGVTVGEAPFY